MLLSLQIIYKILTSYEGFRKVGEGWVRCYIRNGTELEERSER